MNPVLAGRIGWPLTERLLGRDTMRRFRMLMRTDTAPMFSLRAIQTEKLRRLLRLADEHCPFYHDRFRRSGLDAHDPELKLDVLHGLPLLERAEIRNHLEAMTWHDCPGGPARPYNTGGSSGSPLKFYFDRCRQSADWATRWRHRAWWNLRPGDTEVLLWAGPLNKTRCDRLRNWRDRVLNQHILDAFDMTAETMDAYTQRIRQLQPRMLFGYASSLGLLARHMLRKGDLLDDANRPRAVFVTGETVAAQDRSDIERAYNAPAVIEYGSRDCGLIACGCTVGSLHVNQENLIVEVLDERGEPVGPGQVGEVVVTSLESFATPMIRYRLGDLARLPDDGEDSAGSRCACGRASMRLAEIRGRTTDQIVCRDGDRIRRMHALSLIYVLREVDGVEQFRIVQKAIDELCVQIVSDERVTPATQAAIAEGLRARMGTKANVRIERVERIAPTASGKHACVVSELAACND